ncbi:hypothetical protein CCACVL1_07626 [Corchorus capsularis]|uniref:Uncharacterized protein n=1 Tax=Corchorus capsularis TaxID=210143 RepID=A0A1R3J4N5_COCAP|nr:hypothetical protein CCACVL1_07626 [Corchorus capsularis]
MKCRHGFPILHMAPYNGYGRTNPKLALLDKMQRPNKG